jgi:hypothetical protein
VCQFAGAAGACVIVATDILAVSGLVHSAFPFFSCIQLTVRDLYEHKMIVNVVVLEWISRSTRNAIGVCSTAAADKICDPIVCVALIVVNICEHARTTPRSVQL